MPPHHIFKDEWLIQAVQNPPLVSQETIDSIRAQHKPYLADALLRAQAINAETLFQAVETKFGVRAMALSRDSVEKMALSLVSEKLCRNYLLVPFRLEGETLSVAMANPLDLAAQEDVQALSGRTVAPYYSLPQHLESIVTEIFNPEVVLFDILDKIEENETVEILEGVAYDEMDLSDRVATPVIKLVNSIITKAVRMHASDIHIEHDEHNSIIRYRVDGILKNIMTVPKQIGSGPLVSRIKIMGNLNVAEHYRPQDGRAKLKVGSEEIGLRVSTLPTNYGEKVVMRILDSRAAEVGFEQLGFKKSLSDTLSAILGAEQGIILVTGPTGSGKTTTLYSMLNKLKTEATNIVTIEDPIEYKLEGINQVQVNEKQGLMFATALRSVLRQDPDIILVGEIRDRETADIGFQAALTGHLVFSTLHTSDSLATLSRLIDMGVERFKIAPALLAILAQRLIRRLCPHCRQPLPIENLPPVILDLLKKQNLSVHTFKATGCAKCEYLGYKGRLAVVELLKVSQELKDKINSGKSEAELRKTALERGDLIPILSDALWHLSEGDTSVDEILPYLQFRGPEESGPAAPEPIVIPALQESFPPAAPVPAPIAATPQAGPKTVLITDDDPAIRIILKKFLQNEGYSVEEAENGSQALEKIAQKPPQLLIVDLNMPELDGYGVIRGVRQALGNLALPIIMLTSVSDDKSQEDAIMLGADDYIIKPFKPALVVARVNALFRRISQ